MKENTAHRSIKYGDPRVFYESKISKPFNSPAGIYYDVGSAVRGSAFLNVGSNQVSVTLPSMAELIYHEAKRNLDKAQKIKSKALKTILVNNVRTFKDEELFYSYIQCLSVGILGIYSSLEGMVYELYIRKNNKNDLMIEGRSVTFKEFTSMGIVKKLTTVATKLSGGPNIYNTEIMTDVKNIITLRTSIQHWDIELSSDYFVNFPSKHPLNTFITVEPSKISATARYILDNYSLSPRARD